MSKYQDIYPCEPLIQSVDLVRPMAADLLTLEYFERGLCVVLRRK